MFSFRQSQFSSGICFGVDFQVTNFCDVEWFYFLTNLHIIGCAKGLIDLYKHIDHEFDDIFYILILKKDDDELKQFNFKTCDSQGGLSIL